MLRLKKYDVSNDAMNFGFAIVNALVIGKVILVGEMMHLGRGYEKRPLWQSVLLKSVVFSVLVLVFHIVEEVVKRIIHGSRVGRSGTICSGRIWSRGCWLSSARSFLCLGSGNFAG